MAGPSAARHHGTHGGGDRPPHRRSSGSPRSCRSTGRNASRRRGAGAGSVRRPGGVARQRHRSWRRRRRDAADPARVRQGRGDREPLAGPGRRPDVLRDHQAAAQRAARGTGRRRCPRPRGARALRVRAPRQPRGPGGSGLTAGHRPSPRPPDRRARRGPARAGGTRWSGAATWDATCPTTTPGSHGSSSGPTSRTRRRWCSRGGSTRRSGSRTSGWSSSHRRSTRSRSRTRHCVPTTSALSWPESGLVAGGGRRGPGRLRRGATAHSARCGPIGAPAGS